MRLRSSVEWQVVDDEVVVLDLAASLYLGVNPTGAALWPLVAEGTSEAALVEALTARFDIGADRARSDVVAFVARLRSLGLVEEDDAEAEPADPRESAG